MAEGSRRRIIYVPEVTPGTTPPTPSCKTLRANGGSGIKIARQSLQSQEMRSDRQVAALRLGNKSPSLEIPFEFSFGSFDDILESALFGLWAIAYALTAQTVSVVASTKKFTRAAGSWITDGVKVGDKFITTGFEAAGNNGTFIVTAVSALEVTCAAATGLVDVTGDMDVAITTDRSVLKQGVTPKYLSMEEGFADIDVYQVLTGCMANTFGLEVRPNAMVTGSFGMVALGGSAFADASIDATPDAAPTTSPFDAYTGSIKEGGAALAIATGLSLSLANGLESLFALFRADPYRIGVGRANVTGRLSAYFESAAMANKFSNETESSIEFRLTDLAGNSYDILIPRIKYTDAAKSMTENNVLVDMPFQALNDTTEGTSLRIDKRPA